MEIAARVARGQRLWILVFAAFATVGAVACSDVTSPGRVAQGPAREVKPLNAPDVEDIYDCGSFDWGETWNCVDEGPAVVHYDWDEPQGEQWDYWSPFDCSAYAGNCPSGSDQTTGGNYGLAPEPALAGDNDSQATPTCSPMPMGGSSADSAAHAWCIGFTPQPAYRLTRIQAALNKMAVINQTCAILAAIGDSLLAHGTLHLFNHDNYSPFAGVAPQNGGWSGPNSWMALSTGFTDLFYDSNHEDGSPAHRDLQQALAHELDHLLGSTPMHTDIGTYETPNSQVCGGVP